MSRWFRYGLLVLGALLLLWLVIVWYSSGSRASFNAQKMEQSRDRLVTHNAQFLGRDRVGARYKLTLTGERGYTCFAALRLPLADRKLPALLILHTLPSDTAFFAAIEAQPRVNELAFVGLNVTNCFGAPTKETLNVYGAVQLCVDYLHKHFVIDTNQVFMAGVDVGSLYALSAAQLDADQIRAVALQISRLDHATGGQLGAATWAQALLRDSVLAVVSPVQDARSWWERKVGPFPAHSFVRDGAPDLPGTLRQMTEWVLGPPQPKSDTARVEPDAANSRTLKMK